MISDGEPLFAHLVIAIRQGCSKRFVDMSLTPKTLAMFDAFRAVCYQVIFVRITFEAVDRQQ
jgi:hypothetical protein